MRRLLRRPLKENSDGRDKPPKNSRPTTTGCDACDAYLAAGDAYTAARDAYLDAEDAYSSPKPYREARKSQENSDDQP